MNYKPFLSEDIFAYMDHHPDGDGWMIMARPVIQSESGFHPFHPMGNSADRSLPKEQRKPKKYDEGSARKVVKEFSAEMQRVNEEQHYEMV